MSWQTDIAIGAAQRLDDEGVGIWDPDGTAGNVFHGAIAPDVAPGIGILSYRVGADDPAHPTTQVRVQFWLRAATVAALDDLDDGVYKAFAGLTDVMFGDAHVTQVLSLSSVGQGPDGNGNLERSTNYTFQIDLPATALRAY